MLKDLLVIETAGVLAGPAVGMFFAELGATVIKLENQRAGGDVSKVHIAYCPERVLPGKIMTELVENDRVLGGLKP